MNATEIVDKIVHVFPKFKGKGIVFLVPTQCSDLFEAEEIDSWTGTAILQTYTGGTIYVRMPNTELNKKADTKVQTVNPIPSLTKKPTVCEIGLL